MSIENTFNQSGLDKFKLELLVTAAKEASYLGGNILMSHYGNIEKIMDKGTIGDLVTSADIESEAKVIEYLSDKTPDISILAEETGRRDRANKLCWCIDPLDGTTNFANSFPLFATSVGLLWNNQPLLGSINIPYMKENFWGAPGIGVFCNENNIAVSEKSNLQESLLVTGFAYDRKEVVDNNYAEFCWLSHRTRGVRRTGAAAVDLAYVASGRIDGYWERGLSSWDLAAGVALVELSGGVISDYNGDEFDINTGRVVASNPMIYKELISELAKVKPLAPINYGA